LTSAGAAACRDFRRSFFAFKYLFLALVFSYWSGFIREPGLDKAGTNFTFGLTSVFAMEVQVKFDRMQLCHQPAPS
jgi:hypothetical protein